MQEFDGEEFEPEENWNQNYWALIASSLMDNFCEERIDHLEKVGKKVYPVSRRPVSSRPVNGRPENGRPANYGAQNPAPADGKRPKKTLLGRLLPKKEQEHPHISEDRKRELKEKNNEKFNQRMKRQK
jgi:hypothetical protein